MHAILTATSILYTIHLNFARGFCDFFEKFFRSGKIAHLSRSADAVTEKKWSILCPKERKKTFQNQKDML